MEYSKNIYHRSAASDKVYQLLAHGRWFSPSTPASPTTKTGHHDIAEILLKVVLNTKNQIKSNHSFKTFGPVVSEEKIFENDNGRQVMAIAHVALWAR